MASNITISLAADSSQLRAEFAVAQSTLRAYSRELSSAANVARKAGDDLSLAKVGQAAAGFEGASARVSELKVQMEAAAKSGQVLNNTFKLNRGGLMELQASGINAFQALASGMDVFRVATMEGAQVIGGLIQGGLGTFGLMAAAATAAAGAVGYLALQAHQVKQILGGTSADLLLTGRGGGAGDIAQLTQAADGLAKKFNLSKSAAAELISEIAKARTLSPDMVRLVAELAAAEGAVRRGGGESISNVDIAKKLAAALNEGASGAIKLAQGFNLSTTDAEKMLKAGNELGAFRRVLADIADHIRSHGGAWAEAKARADEYQRGLNSIVGSMGELGAAGIAEAGKIVGPKPPWPSEKPTGGSGIAGAPPTTGGDVSPEGVRALNDLDRRTQEAIARGERPPGYPSGAENQFAEKAAQEKAIKDAAAAFQEQEVEHRNSLNRQAQDSVEYQKKIKKLAGEGTDAEVSAKQQAIQKLAAVYDQDTQLQLGALRQQQTQATDIADKIRIQKQIIGTVQARGASPYGGGGANPAELQQERTALAALDRQQIQQNFQLAEQGASAQRAANADILRGYQAQEQEAVRLGQISPLQALDAEMVKAKELAAENATELHKLYEAATNNTDRIKTYWELWREGVRAATEAQQLLAQKAQETKAIAEKWAEPVKSAFESIGSSFESALSGLITGSKTWADALKGIETSAISSLVSGAGSIMSKIAAKEFFGAKAGEGLGEALFNNIAESIDLKGMLGLGGQTANTAAISANTAALAANTAALGASAASSAGGGALSAAGGAANAASGGGFLGSLFGVGGFFGSQGALFGTAADASIAAGGAPLALDAAPEALALLALSGGGIIPSAAGGWRLPSFPGAQPALLHSKEMVLPAHISEGIQSAIAGGGLGGGGGDAHFHLHAVAADGPAVERLFKQNGRMITDAVKAGMRSNALTPRTI